MKIRDTESVKRGLSVRLPAETMVAYTDLIEGAGLTVSENIRLFVDQLLTRLAAEFDLSTLEVKPIFKWRISDDFPEHVGSLSVEVRPPIGMSADMLNQLVFVIPEFFNESGYEPFRVDSNYYHRVSNGRIAIGSTRVQRAILSFRLIKGCWNAGLYYYGRENFDQKAFECQLSEAVIRHITNTIACALLDQLPESRRLKPEEVAGWDSLLTPSQRGDSA